MTHRNNQSKLSPYSCLCTRTSSGTVPRPLEQVQDLCTRTTGLNNTLMIGDWWLLCSMRLVVWNLGQLSKWSNSVSSQNLGYASHIKSWLWPCVTWQHNHPTTWLFVMLSNAVQMLIFWSDGSSKLANINFHIQINQLVLLLVTLLCFQRRALDAIYRVAGLITSYLIE